MAKRILLTLALFVPALAVIVFQFATGIFSIVNIIVLVLIVFICLAAIKTKKSVSTQQLVQNKDVLMNANTGEHKFPRSTNFIAKIFCIGLAILFAVFSWYSYTNMVKKYESRFFALYDAEVVRVIDDSFSEYEYTTDGTFSETKYLQCEVTFKYFNGEDYKEVSKTFKGITRFPEKNLKIYVINNEVEATEHIITAGKIVSISLAVMAVLSLLMLIFNFNTAYIIITTLFLTGSTLAVGFSMAASPLAVLYIDYLSILAMLLPVGLFVFGHGVYHCIKEKKENKFI